MTKHILIVVLIFLASYSTTVAAVDTEKAISEATQAFHQGRYKDAIEILAPSVKENHPLATYMTGILHFRLTPPGAPPTLALMFYEKAAKLGHTAAFLDIGFAYQQGAGLPRDFVKALKYFTLAFMGEDSRAQALAAYAIGGLYLNGLSVEKSATIAREWYQKSADLGYGDATKMLKELGNID